MSLSERLLQDPEVAREPIAQVLVPILGGPTNVSSAGYPYMEQAAWEAFRDHVPHLLGMGLRVARLVERLETLLGDAPANEERDSLVRACKVARQVTYTAAITAPPDLWLLRHVLGFYADLGLLERLLAGEALYPRACQVFDGGRRRLLDPQELDADLRFLLSRGFVEQYDESYRIAGHPRVRQVLRAVRAVPAGRSAGVASVWRALFSEEALAQQRQEDLLELAHSAPRRTDPRQNHWIPTSEEVSLGYRLVPIVLGLRAAGKTAGLKRGRTIDAAEWSPRHPACAGGALEVLAAAGWVERAGEAYTVTAIGQRGFGRGPGPFGIIEAYHPYMGRGREILLEGRGDAWVARGENIGASQDANRRTFEQPNDALDRFCAETGFEYRVFIEHAIGRGEATRQRFERSGEDTIRYFGADLEDAAIDAAIAEQAAGRLPKNMLFVRGADIGQPAPLIEALRAAGVSPEGAVMLVGNGFHEVRDQTDEGMVSVFAGYEAAGVLLLFTEENALSIDDLRATAWNTYHAGFKYVHEKSGQGLRPAEPRAAARLGRPLRAAWSECAQRAGYVRATAYCVRTRTIYPYTPPSGHNPSISANHFFVPGRIAARLGL